MNTLNWIFGFIYIALAIAFVWGVLLSKGKEANQKIYFGFHIIYFAWVVGFAWCFAKVIDIQYFSKKSWCTISENMKYNKKETTFAKRGTIYASNGEVLSEDWALYKIYFNGQQVHNIRRDIKEKKITVAEFKENDSIKQLAKQLSEFFNDKSAASYEEILFKAYRNKNKQLLHAKINIIDLGKISKFTLFNGGKNKQYGTCLLKDEIANRMMPYNGLAKGIIGSIHKVRQGDYYMGQYGIEHVYDSLLRGKNGEQQDLKISNRKKVSKILTPKRDGDNIVLTLDVDFQEIVTNSLYQKIEEYNRKNTNIERACVILMEVETGAIKAITNLVQTSDGTYSEPNGGTMAIVSNNELGSVFKVPSIMVALENGLISNPDSMIYVKSTPYSGMKDHAPFKEDYLSVTQVIAKSSNVGMANIFCPAYHGNKSKNKIYFDAMSALKFDAPINFELYVPSPIIENVERVNDFQRRVIGYICVSPLYMLRFYNAIANNGKMINPFIIKDKRTVKGKSLKGFPKTKGEIVTEKICSERTLGIVQNMLFEVVNSGTAKGNKSKTVTFAGKTGTADIISENASQGTFCGYFPAEKPKYSCIVVMYKKTVGGGNLWGTESCSVFKDIAEKINALVPMKLEEMKSEE